MKSRIYKFFFALLRFSLGIDEAFEHRLSAEEWTWMREEAIRQALVGVLYMGVKKLPEDVRPPYRLLMQWAFDAENIRGTNQKVNAVAVRLTQMFKERGRESVILKGPANALLYPDPFVRSCGDVDIMLPGGRDSVVKLLTEMKLMDGADVGAHHAHLDDSLFDVSVEVHYVPTEGANSPSRNRLVQEFLTGEFANSKNAQVGFNVPSIKYALVMQLAHIKEHFFGVGIGLRQLVDYYMLLKHSSAEDRATVASLLKSFGLLRIAQAVMWLLQNCVGLDEEYLLCRPDAWRGKRLLNVALVGGNFGVFDEKFAGPQPYRWYKHYKRAAYLLRFDFSEALWYEFWALTGVPRRVLKTLRKK